LPSQKEDQVENQYIKGDADLGQHTFFLKSKIAKFLQKFLILDSDSGYTNSKI